MVSCGADKSLIFRQLQQVSVSWPLPNDWIPCLWNILFQDKKKHTLNFMFSRRMGTVRCNLPEGTISSARQPSTIWNPIRAKNTFWPLARTVASASTTPQPGSTARRSKDPPAMMELWSRQVDSLVPTNRQYDELPNENTTLNWLPFFFFVFIVVFG